MSVDTGRNAERRSSAGEVAADWWRSLESDRGGRADLRRCHTTLQIQFTPAFHRLLQRLPASGENDYRAGWLAAVAGVLAHVQADCESGESFPAILASAQAGDRAVLSGLRFRRLLACESPDDLLVGMRRAVQVAGSRAPVAALANDMLWWNDRTKKNWATTYYRVAPAQER